MSKAETIERFLVTQLAAGGESARLDPDEDLLAAELLDSLGIQELVTFLEATYGIKVEDDDLVVENFRSVNAIARFAERKG